MAEKMYIDELSGLGSKKNTKKHSKSVKTRENREFHDRVDKHNDAMNGTSLSKEADKSRIEIKKKKKQRPKMGCPIIVEDTIGKCSTVRIPMTLRHAVDDKSVRNASQSLKVFGLGKKKNREGKNSFVITQGDCINPSGDIRKSKAASHESLDKMITDDDSLTNERKLVTNGERMEEQESSLKNNETKMQETIEVAIDDNLERIDSKPLPRFYSFRNKVLTIVEPDCNFSFHGKLRIRVLYGSIKVYGTCLSRSTTRIPVEVYSPRAYSAVAIEAIESEIADRSTVDLWESLADQCTDRKFAKRLQTEIERLDDGWSVVEMENFDNHLTTFLETYCPYHLFPKIEDPSNHSWRDSRRAEIILQANLRSLDCSKQLTIDSRGIDDFAESICYDWETKGSSRTIIAGGKGVGKSTTARYLVNKLLTKSIAVLVLDLDIGQAEFTPAGCVSLNIVENPILGPNFTHLKTPYHQIYVGGIDVTRCLTQYVDAVKKLVEGIHLDNKLTRLPLVVNTMGFCKGIGWDIIKYIIKILSPTDVLQILSKRSKNNFDDTLSRQVIDRQTLGSLTWTKTSINMDKPAKHQLHVIYSEAETGAGSVESWNLEAHQQRDLVMLAYLSKIVEKDGGLFTPRTLTCPSINAVAPYAVPFSAVSVALAGALIPQVLSVMNGNIVALCGIGADNQVEEEQNNQENASYPRVLVRPPLSTCYGFGILRGVDMDKEKLYVNTPLSSEIMQRVNCLVGCINLPPSLLQLNQQGAPYTGSEYDLPTSRGSRRGYYRMRYQVDT